MENLQIWLDAVARAVAMPENEWPAIRTNTDGLPPIKLWRDRFPEKFAPLSHARALIEAIAAANTIPVENLISPETVRRICWSPPPGATTSRDETSVSSALIELGARQWQVDLVASAIADALLEKEPLVIPEPALENEGAEELESVAKATE